MTMKHPLNSASPFLCAMLFYCSHAGAASATESLTTDPLTINPNSPWYALNFESGWHIDAALGIEYEPTYAGADQYETEGDISVRALYRTDAGHRYFISLGEAGALLTLSPTTQLQFFLEYEEERNDEDDTALTGMDTIDSTIEGQLILARRFGNAIVFGALQPDLKGDADKGLVWFIGASYDAMLKQQWRVGTRIDISGADSEYMRTEFGVTRQESQRTNYTAYNPGAGLKSASLGFNTEYRLTDQFSLQGSIEAEYYFSKASDSPLIDQEGSDVTAEANIGLRWQF